MPLILENASDMQDPCPPVASIQEETHVLPFYSVVAADLIMLKLCQHQTGKLGLMTGFFPLASPHRPLGNLAAGSDW